MATTQRPRKTSRHIKRGDAGVLIMLVGLDEDSSRAAVAMPDTILARVKLEQCHLPSFGKDKIRFLSPHRTVRELETHSLRTVTFAGLKSPFE
jgi:hypothetical protein